MNNEPTSQLHEARKTWRAEFRKKYASHAIVVVLAVLVLHGLCSALLIGYGLESVSPYVFFSGTASMFLGGIAAPAVLARTELGPYPTATRLRKTQELIAAYKKSQTPEA